MRTLSRAASELVARYVPAPPVEWATPSASASGSVHDMVLVDEVLRLVVSRRRDGDDRAPPPPPMPLPRRRVEVPERYAATVAEARARLVTPEGELRSGVVHMPCGAGKTLVGCVAALELASEPVLVVTPSREASQQWRSRLEAAGADVWVAAAAGANASRQPRAVVMTYALLGQLAAQNDADVARLVPVWVWRYGMVILDEVHTAPARTYAQALAVLRARARLGLTADERRCDQRQDTLRSLVGPVLYELTEAQARARGVISTLHRVVRVVPVSAPFRALYQRADTEHRRYLAVLNPHKVDAMVRALRGVDKAIVFCDKVAALPHLRAALLAADGALPPLVGVLSGETPAAERDAVCRALREAPQALALFSRVGNASIDVPDVGFVIEMSVVDSSAQQKTQRDGRVQRLCAGKCEGTVLTLVSADTHEVRFARARAASVRDGDTVWEQEGGEGTPACPWDDRWLAGKRSRGWEE